MLISSYLEGGAGGAGLCKYLDSHVVAAGVLGRFCEPEASPPPPSPGRVRKHFFLLPGTVRLWGFCRREWRGEEWAWTCLCSRHCHVGMFFVLLDHLAALEPPARLAYLETLFQLPVPPPGKSYPAIGGSALRLRMPNSRYYMGEVNCTPLFESLPASMVFKVLCVMLLERKFVFSSRSTERVVSCTHAILSLLYPFAFEHLFMTLLPCSMLEYTTAPFPFVFGTTASIDDVKKLPIETINFVDLDARDCTMSRSDLELLPACVPQYIARLKKCKATSPIGTAKWNTMVQDVVLDFFVELVGTYSVYLSSSGGSFDDEAFVADSEAPLFLERFVESQMWSSFIERRAGGQVRDEFERRSERALQQSRSQTSILPATPSSRTLSFSQMFQQLGASFRGADTSSESSMTVEDSPASAPPAVVRSSSRSSNSASPPPIPPRTYQRTAEPLGDLLSFESLSLAADAPPHAEADAATGPSFLGDMISFDLAAPKTPPAQGRSESPSNSVFDDVPSTLSPVMPPMQKDLLLAFDEFRSGLDSPAPIVQKIDARSSSEPVVAPALLVTDQKEAQSAQHAAPDTLLLDISSLASQPAPKEQGSMTNDLLSMDWSN